MHITLLNNKFIERVYVASEASILEFSKQSGDYAGTSKAEYVDDVEDQKMFFGEMAISPPSQEISIKVQNNPHLLLNYKYRKH